MKANSKLGFIEKHWVIEHFQRLEKLVMVFYLWQVCHLTFPCYIVNGIVYLHNFLKGLKASITFEVWQLDTLTIEITIGYIINDTIYLLNNNRWRSIIEIVLSKIVNLITSYQVTNFLAFKFNFKNIDNLVLNCHIFISLFMHISGVYHRNEEEICKVCHSKYAWMNFGLLSNILYICIYILVGFW